MGVSILVDRKDNSYDLILIIVNFLTKIVYYKLVKTTINIVGLVEVIINIVVSHYDLLELIISH